MKTTSKPGVKKIMWEVLNLENEVKADGSRIQRDEFAKEHQLAAVKLSKAIMDERTVRVCSLAAFNEAQALEKNKEATIEETVKVTKKLEDSIRTIPVKEFNQKEDKDLGVFYGEGVIEITPRMLAALQFYDAKAEGRSKYVTPEDIEEYEDIIK